MHSKVNKLLATTTMLVAMGLFAAMSPAWAQNTGQQNQTPQQTAQPNQQQQQPGQAQQPGAQPSQNAEPGQQATPGQEGQQDQQQGMQSSKVEATGCIESTGGGQYSLTDQATNQTWTLTSSNVDLSKHVGHEVTVTGTPSNSGAAGTPAGQAGGAQTLDVTKVKTVSNSCSSSSGGTPPSIL